MIPVYDALYGEYGNLCAVLQIPFVNTTERDKFNEAKDILINRLPFLVNEIKNAAVFEILKQPIEGDDLLEHFIKYLTMLQDWEFIRVFQIKNSDEILLNYCYRRREEDRERSKWKRCEKNYKECEGDCCIKVNNDGILEDKELSKNLVEDKKKHIPCDEINFGKGHKHKLLLKNIFTERYIPELDAYDKSKCKNKMVIYEYPSYTIIPDNELTEHPLGLYYERQQIDLLRQVAIKRKVMLETIRHGTRAAVTAIISRNLAHCISSNVLSFLVSEYNLLTLEDEAAGTLQKQISNLFEKFSTEVISLLNLMNNGIKICDKDVKDIIDTEIGSPFNRFIKNNRYLLKYLKDRMDFIATILTFVPSCNTMFFKRDIIGTKGEELYSKNQDSINYDTDINGKYHLTDNFFFEPLNLILHYISFSEKLLGQNILREKIEIKLAERISETKVAIPGGVIGKQAFYIILENIIRNATKHSALYSQESKMVFTIDFPDEPLSSEKKVNYDNNEFLRITITDNLYSADDKLVAKLQEKCEGAIVKSDGSFERVDLGIKEKKIAAAFLRAVDPTEIVGNEIKGWKDDDSKKILVIGKDSAEEKGNLQYGFFLLKPKEVLIITDDMTQWNVSNNKLIELRNAGIDFVTNAEKYTSNVISFNDFETNYRSKKPRHRFLVIDLKDSSLLSKLDFNFLPYRRILPQNIESEHLKNKLYNFKDTINLLNIIYEIFINNEYGFKVFPNLFIDKIFYTDYWHRIEGIHEFKDFENSGTFTNACLYINHFNTHIERWRKTNNILDKIKDNEIIAIEPIVGSNSLKSKITNPSDILKYELIEASLTKICIIDERLYKIAQDRRMEEILSIRGVFLYDLIRNDNTLYIISLTGNDSFTIQNFSGILSLENNPRKDYVFLTIHQGVIDKIIENYSELEKNDVDSIKKVLDLFNSLTKNTIIHSGRGNTELIPKGTRFLNYPELENWFYDDKHSMVQGFYGLRGMGEK